MTTTATPRRYRWIDADRDDGTKRRVLVVPFKGWDGYVVRWTEDCFGCTEHGEYGGKQWGPFGCEECGYTGKRRRTEWIPFDSTGWYASRDRVWARVERFRSYLRSRDRAATTESGGGV